jgi:TRAP-type mannitol/chloroaromatic compound transport system permease small subunit
MTGYTLVFLAFLAAPYTLHLDGHVYVDTIVIRFSKTAQLWTKLFLSMLALVFMVALTYFGWEQAMRSYTLGFHSSSAFGPPLFIFQIFIPIGAFLLTVQQLVIMSGIISRLAGRRVN